MEVQDIDHMIVDTKDVLILGSVSTADVLCAMKK